MVVAVKEFIFCNLHTACPNIQQPVNPEFRMAHSWIKTTGGCGSCGFPKQESQPTFCCICCRPKIADYAFTTLVPNLGVVSYREDKSFVMADIPGIIEGAAEGKGLGIQFLRHIERNSLLLFMIPADAKDIKTEYGILLNELKKYNPE